MKNVKDSSPIALLAAYFGVSRLSAAELVSDILYGYDDCYELDYLADKVGCSWQELADDSEVVFAEDNLL